MGAKRPIRMGAKRIKTYELRHSKCLNSERGRNVFPRGRNVSIGGETSHIGGETSHIGGETSSVGAKRLTGGGGTS